jgi:hypothetical protein
MMYASSSSGMYMVGFSLSTESNILLTSLFSMSSVLPRSYKRNANRALFCQRPSHPSHRAAAQHTRLDRFIAVLNLAHAVGMLAATRRAGQVLQP